MKLSPEIKSKLMRFVHRQIKPGEAFLLARLLADRIPIATESVEPWAQTLKYRQQVDGVIYGLNEYLHISQHNISNIHRMVERLWAWRLAVATGQSNLLFSGEVNNVVDDVTGILRSVNMSDIAPVADICQDANYIYDLFRQVVQAGWEPGA